ncbi:tail fiber protein [Candidatus Symbiopectobacterium sp. NZEC127]|nr:tail fiber protein [Candidatus Symbiopectobacterium sp. NZEC127]
MPAGRKVNGKPLTADITLGATDVGALPVSGTAATANKLASARTINGVAFDGSTNITLPLDLLVGTPVPYPLSTAPTGWLKCNGQTFNKATYPQLALVYPSGVLPDLRAEFIRGFDDGRGVDTGRTLLSAQGDAIRNITGKFANNGLAWAEGTTSSVGEGAFTRLEGNILSNNNLGSVGCQYTFDASKVVPTANENRPRNIAFNYIVRAA